MRAQSRVLPLLVALPLALAGCVSLPLAQQDGGVADPLADLPARVAALVGEVPCEAESVSTTDTSSNFATLAHLPMEGSNHAEIDLRGNLLLSSRYGDGGFDVVDVTDPLNPVHVTTFESEGTSLDVKWVRDTSGALIGTPGGVTIVDMRDPASPVEEGRWKFPGTGVFQNAHMLFFYHLEGASEHGHHAETAADPNLVFVAPNSNDGVYVLQLEGEPGARTLTMIGKIAAGINGPLGPHDMWATFDEDLGTHVLYIANGFYGWLAYDIMDPANAELLGGFVNPDAHQGYVHTVQAAKVGDRRLVVTISEVGANAMRVFDATDLSKPVPLGSWTRDNAAVTDMQHNLQVVGETLYFAHYDHGVFTFDLTKVGTTPLAQTQMLQPSGLYAVDGGSAWDVLLKDGLVYVSDISQGLHVATFGCAEVGNPAFTSTG